MQSQIYNSMMSVRESYLDRARYSSSLTIPYLMPRDGFTHSSQLNQPWESTGGFLLNNLANKVMQSLFPASLPWVRFDLIAAIVMELDELPDEQKQDLLQQLNTRLSNIERLNFTRQVLKDGDPIVLARAILHLLLSGNYCLQVMKSGKLKGRPLTQYVTERDDEGTVTKAIILDKIAFGKLDADIKQVVMSKRLGMQTLGLSMTEGMADVEVYTHIEMSKEGTYDVWTETMGEVVPGSQANYPVEDMPYIFSVLILLDGEHYGRGYVEGYCGDLQSLDAMSETVQRGTAAAAKLVNFVRPGGVTRKDALQRARAGDTISGVETDVGQYRANKGADFQASLTIQDRILDRLNTAFLWGVGKIRDAERVTAKEISFLSQALEEQLGTGYAQLGSTLQTPYARLKTRAMQRNGTLPSFSLEQIDISILTGAAALTRQSKTSSLLQGLSIIQSFAPNRFEEKLDIDTLTNIVSEGDGYSYAGVMKSEEEVTRDRRERLAEETLSKQLQAQGAQQQPQQPSAPQPALQGQ